MARIGTAERRGQGGLRGMSLLGAAGALSAAVFAVPVSAAIPPGTISGTAFRDYNANGQRDALEPGQAGLTVRAYSAAALVDTRTTAADGSYSLTVPNGTAVRVEVAGLPAFLTSGPHGSGSGTTVQFVTSPTDTANVGVLNAGEYCQANPTIVTNCFAVSSEPSTAKVLVKLHDGENSRTPATGSPDANDGVAMAGQIGATWGLGYQASSDSVFSAAYTKRHTLFGPGGAGAIYRSAPGADGFFGGGDDVTSIFATVANAGTNPHPGTNPEVGDAWRTDAAGFRAVGKVGLGDLDVSEDGQDLYTVNLNTRELIRIPLGGTAAAPTPGAQVAVAVPTPFACAGPARPFGLGLHDGQVYVGGICSDEGSFTGNGSMTAYVFRFDPSSNTFAPTPVLDFGLNYPRGCADKDGTAQANATIDPPGNYETICPPGGLSNHLANWHPWDDAANELGVSQRDVYPEPMFTDIAFDRDQLVIGLRDRHGDQVGGNNGTFDIAGGFDQFSGYSVSAGDVLRACATASGWNIEQNASCGGVTTAGDNNSQGPGNGEFYFSDYHRSLGEQGLSGPVGSDATDGGHDEISSGGLLQIPGRPGVAVTSITPVQGGFDTLFSGGVMWLNNTTGARDGSYQVYASSPTLFGKANGLGDLEALCQGAPIEIGNRVWSDTNNNGIQEPGEAGISGVVVALVGPSGNQTTTTDSSGTYYFTVKPATTYTIRIDKSQSALTGLTTSPVIAGSNMAIDSNGVMNGNLVTSSVTTGRAGANDHTIDFGFAKVGTPVTPVVVLTGTPAPVTAPLVSALAKSALLGITKVGPPTAQRTGTFSYSITVRVLAKSGVAATNVVVRDVLPIGLTLVSKNQASRIRAHVRAGGISWNLGTMQRGESKTVQVTVRVAANASGKLVNVATASASNGAPVTAKATTTIKIVPRPVVTPPVTG